MEVTTIIGIVVAVIIILLGLRMILRKSDDAAPSLESELHINSDSKLPVIPRHVRDQLQTESAIEQSNQRIEPALNGLEKSDVPNDQKDQSQLADSSTADVLTVEKDQAVDLASNSLEQESNTDQSTEAHIDAVDSASSNLNSVEKNASTSPPVEKAKTEVAAYSLNPNIETAEIKDFDEESSILDVHLHEQRRSDDESTLANAESLISLNVHPNPRKALSGDKTLKVLLKYGLRFGEMNCFHRYENPEQETQLMFSVLRITDEGPAGFDLESLSGEQVQGLAFFLALPHTNVQRGFDTMVSIAGLIAREIDGTVYDENNLEFTPQLKEHWRHKAIDYRAGQKA